MESTYSELESIVYEIKSTVNNRLYKRTAKTAKEMDNLSSKNKNIRFVGDAKRKKRRTHYMWNAVSFTHRLVQWSLYAKTNFRWRPRRMTSSNLKVPNKLTETWRPGLPYTFFIYDIMLWPIDTCQIKLSADQYHVTISRAQVYSSSRSRVLLKFTTDQVLVFDWIGGSCQVKLLKTEEVTWKPVNSNPGLKVNQIITVSSLQMLCLQLLFCDY